MVGRKIVTLMIWPWNSVALSRSKTPLGQAVRSRSGGCDELGKLIRWRLWMCAEAP